MIGREYKSDLLMIHSIQCMRARFFFITKHQVAVSLGSCRTYWTIFSFPPKYILTLSFYWQRFASDWEFWTFLLASPIGSQKQKRCACCAEKYACKFCLILYNRRYFIASEKIWCDLNLYIYYHPLRIVSYSMMCCCVHPKWVKYRHWIMCNVFHAWNYSPTSLNT